MGSNFLPKFYPVLSRTGNFMLHIHVEHSVRCLTHTLF